MLTPLTRLISLESRGALLAQTGDAAPAWLPSGVAGAAVVAGLGVIVWQVLSRRKAAKPARPGPYGAPAHAQPGMESFGREAADVVEHLSSVLDAKAERIERLLEAADQRIRQLERVAGVQARRDEFTDGSRRAIRSHGSSGAADDAVPGDGGLQDRIVQLAERGQTPVEIARQLQQPIGQVELIIALRRGAARL